jgi:hypothetical protein
MIGERIEEAYRSAVLAATAHREGIVWETK